MPHRLDCDKSEQRALEKLPADAYTAEEVRKLPDWQIESFDDSLALVGLLDPLLP